MNLARLSLNSSRLSRVVSRLVPATEVLGPLQTARLVLVLAAELLLGLSAGAKYSSVSVESADAVYK